MHKCPLPGQTPTPDTTNRSPQTLPIAEHQPHWLNESRATDSGGGEFPKPVGRRARCHRARYAAGRAAAAVAAGVLAARVRSRWRAWSAVWWSVSVHWLACCNVWRARVTASCSRWRWAGSRGFFDGGVVKSRAGLGGGRDVWVAPCAVSSTVASWWRTMCSLRRWTRSWCRRHSNTQLSREWLPPSCQWWMWWTSVQAGDGYIRGGGSVDRGR